MRQPSIHGALVQLAKTLACHARVTSSSLVCVARQFPYFGRFIYSQRMDEVNKDVVQIGDTEVWRVSLYSPLTRPTWSIMPSGRAAEQRTVWCCFKYNIDQPFLQVFIGASKKHCIERSSSGRLGKVRITGWLPTARNISENMVNQRVRIPNWRQLDQLLVIGLTSLAKEVIEVISGGDMASRVGSHKGIWGMRRERWLLEVDEIFKSDDSTSR